MNIRIGQGIDVHQLAVDESLIIGGGKIPSNKGLCTKVFATIRKIGIRIIKMAHPKT
mgnify:CR=1 FL=1